jgi:hypothetical protein
MSAIDPVAYRRVIQSARWRALKARLLRERGPRCERCGKQWAPGYPPKLELHHTTYERLGHERDTDVQLVCGGVCHDHADAERARQAQQRAASALYAARLDGWARRKYGDDMNPEDVADEFDAWLSDE